jgi:hypothetical protein
MSDRQTVSEEPAADQSGNAADPELAPMVVLLEEYLARQLQAVLASATQSGASDNDNLRKFH